MILHIVTSATLYNVPIEEKVSIPQRQVALAHLGGAQQVHGKVLSLQSPRQHYAIKNRVKENSAG